MKIWVGSFRFVDAVKTAHLRAQIITVGNLKLHHPERKTPTAALGRVSGLMMREH